MHHPFSSFIIPQPRDRRFKSYPRNQFQVNGLHGFWSISQLSKKAPK